MISFTPSDAVLGAVLAPMSEEVDQAEFVSFHAYDAALSGLDPNSLAVLIAGEYQAAPTMGAGAYSLLPGMSGNEQNHGYGVFTARANGSGVIPAPNYVSATEARSFGIWVFSPEAAVLDAVVLESDGTNDDPALPAVSGSDEDSLCLTALLSSSASWTTNPVLPDISELDVDDTGSSLYRRAGVQDTRAASFSSVDLSTPDPGFGAYWFAIRVLLGRN